LLAGSESPGLKKFNFLFLFSVFINNTAKMHRKWGKKAGTVELGFKGKGGEK
jgi:hypothetical protein